jgi:hypothetical protein
MLLLLLLPLVLLLLPHQVGMGGGMKAGVNIWRALKANRCTHKAWEHLKHAPLTEADLPRAIEPITGSLSSKPSLPTVPEQAVAAVKGGVARKPTVEVAAYDEVAAAH